MNKILRFSLMAVLAIMGFGNAFAEKEVVIDFNALDIATSHGANADEGIEASNAGDITTTWTTTIDGVTVSVSPKEEGKTNENRFWDTKNGPQLRAYSGTITISAGESMTGIAFTSSTNKFNLTASTGTLDGKKWSGEASEVVFTVAGNTQLDKITITIGGSATPPDPTGDNITVAKALEIIDGLEDGAKTNDEYTVKGYVVAVTEINASYGNATFTMADEKGGSSTLTVFRCKGFDGANITNSELLKVDDLVEVKGLLQKYVKDGVMTPEMAQGGKIISINGKTTEGTDPGPGPGTLVGDGTKANPYTVSDLLSMEIPGSTSIVEGQEPVYVKGFMVGALNSSGKDFQDDVASNVALGETASETDPLKCIPVQLQTGVIRTGLNIVDNPENKGKDVIIQGYLLKYMSRMGIKNIVSYILNGTEVSGITSVTADQLKNAPAYNLKGQRVNQSYKGLIIKGGMKLIQR